MISNQAITILPAAFSARQPAGHTLTAMSTPPTGQGVVFSGDGVSASAAEIGAKISELAAAGAIVRPPEPHLQEQRR